MFEWAYPKAIGSLWEIHIELGILYFILLNLATLSWCVLAN